jgi:hydroxypyruvate isomerase
MKMKRREFLGGLGATAMAASSRRARGQGNPPPRGLRLSVTCDMFRGPDAGLPFDNPGRTDPRPQPVRRYSPHEALELCLASGYQGFEMFNWRDPVEREAYLEAQKAFELDCVCLGAHKGPSAPGCSLVDPAERESFLREVTSCVEAGKPFGARRLVALTGMEREGVSRKEQMDSCVAGLRAAVPILERHDASIIVEPINTIVTRPGFFLTTASEGFRMLERVGSPRVQLLFDIYHQQAQEGNLINLIRDHIDQIGHFQIGDHPGRHQPGTGEINYRNVFRAIYELQQEGRYPGYAALEYHPTVPLAETMRAVRQLANFP